MGKALETQRDESKARAAEKGREASDDLRVYFRKPDVDPDLFPLEEGDQVSFELYIDDKGAGAHSVQGAEGAPKKDKPPPREKLEDWPCPNTDCKNHNEMVFGKHALFCPNCYEPRPGTEGKSKGKGGKDKGRGKHDSDKGKSDKGKGKSDSGKGGGERQHVIELEETD